MFNREIGRSSSDSTTLPNIFCFRAVLLWKSKKTYTFVQCLHSLNLYWYQEGETSHLLVKHRLYVNTEFNFDIVQILS